MPEVQLDGRGLTLAYDDVGGGVPLVLLHAFPFDRTMWAPQRDALSAAGCRVLPLDLPGFGGSTAGTAPFSIEGAADVVADFLKALHVGPAVIGGLSMGGYVAMAYARRHPEQLRALILADTRAEPDDEAGRVGRDRAIAAVQTAGVAAFIEGMLPKLLSEPSRRSAALFSQRDSKAGDARSEQSGPVERVRSIASRQSASAVVAALAALRDRPDAVAGLGSVKVPTLAVVGELDTVTPPATAARIAAHVRGCELAHIPGAGHLSNLENPDAFNSAVTGFIERLVG